MRRSHAFGLATNKASDEDISAAITPKLSDDISRALQCAADEQAPASDEQILVLVTAIAVNVGQNWRVDAKEEWIDGVTRDLLDLPGGMVIDALTRARKRVTDGRFVLNWVVEDVEPKARKLAVEIETLQKLSALAAA